MDVSLQFGADIVWEDVLPLISSREEAGCLLSADISVREMIIQIRGFLASFQHVRFQDSCFRGALQSGNPYNKALAPLLQSSIEAGSERFPVQIQLLQSSIDELQRLEILIRGYSFAHINKKNDDPSSSASSASSASSSSSSIPENGLLLSEIELKLADRIRHVLRCATERVGLDSPIASEDNTKKRKADEKGAEEDSRGAKEPRLENEVESISFRSPQLYQNSVYSKNETDSSKDATKERIPLSELSPPNSQQEEQTDALGSKSQEHRSPSNSQLLSEEV